MRIRFVNCLLTIALAVFPISVVRAGSATATLNVSVVITEPKLASVLVQLDDRAKLVRRVSLMKAQLLDVGAELNWRAGNGSGQVIVTGKTRQDGTLCSTVSERIMTGSRSVTYQNLACG